jgi:hypothetical protein
MDRGFGLPRKAGRLREESNIAPPVLAGAKAYFLVLHKQETPSSLRSVDLVDCEEVMIAST